MIKNSCINFTRLMPGVLFLITVLVLQGCAYAPQMERLNVNELPVAQKKELVNVPFFPQTRYQCGPAALATVLGNQNLDVQPVDLVSKVYIPNRKGSFQIEMVSTIRQFGLMSYIIEPSIEDLLKEVDAGNPVLVLQNLAFDSFPQWHFAVVVGYDLAQSKVILRSATTKRWITSLRNFEQTWRKSGYWGVVAVQPGTLPKTARLSRWLSAAYDLEQVGQLDSAEKAFMVATRNWSKQANTWIALTNLFYKQKRYDEAKSEFETALSEIEKDTMLWNNYAYILKAKQCYLGAKEAASCALKRAPENKNIKATYKEMMGLPMAGNQCTFLKCE